MKGAVSVLTRLLSIQSNPSQRYVFLATAIGWLLITLGMIVLLLRMQVITVATSDFTQDYVAAQALRADLSIYADFSRDGPNAQSLRARRSYETPPPVAN